MKGEWENAWEYTAKWAGLSRCPAGQDDVQHATTVSRTLPKMIQV